jgi:nucleoside-diphosphate-sugar epimerase
MKTVIVTGGEGFVGRYICEEFLVNGWTVVSVDDQSKFGSERRSILSKDIHKQRMDVRHGTVPHLFRGWKPDVVVDAASIVGGMNMIYGQGDPFRNLSRNVDMHAHVIDACLKCDNPPHLFTISSSAIYEQEAALNIDRKALAERLVRLGCTPNKSMSLAAPHEIATSRLTFPRHWYGQYKYICEQYTQMSGLDYTILRLYNWAGVGDIEGESAHVIPQLVRRFKSGDGTVFGTGLETRTFVHCSDVARIIFLIYEAGLVGDIFNVAKEHAAITISELAMRIRDIINPRLLLSFKESETPSCIKHSLGNAQHLDNYGIRALVTLEEIIEEACNAYN